MFFCWCRLVILLLQVFVYLSIEEQADDIYSLLLLLYDSLLGNLALTSLSLPTSLVTISSYAFSFCVALPTVIIPT